VNVGNTSEYSVTLPPGTYTVTPESYSPDNISVYTPTPPSRTVEVKDQATTTASFTYALQPGSLTISVTGLPSGVTVTVTVSGPNYNNSFTWGNGTYTLTNLTPGTYTVQGSEYRPDCSVYNPTTNPVSATVRSGQTASASLDYYKDDSGCCKKWFGPICLQR
jgi:hypothetical protein